MTDFLSINGTPEQVSNGDVYGFFRTIFNDGYFLTNVGSIDDEQLLKIASLFGQPWNKAQPTLTVAKVEKPEFIAQTDSIIEAHNECAYSHTPPRLLLLYCVENETEGGNFFTVSPRDLIEEIGVEYVTSLRHAIFNCQVTPDTPPVAVPILRMTEIGEQIIYSSIGASVGDSIYSLTQAQDEYSAGLPNRLNQVLNDPKNRRQHRWQTGDLLIIDNLQMMHGRESFSGGNRTLRHLRLV